MDIILILVLAISHIFGHGKFNKYIYFPKEFNASYQSLKLLNSKIKPHSGPWCLAEKGRGGGVRAN
jgi:hypothetical protein